MKTRLTKTTWAMLIALATATSCSETETEINPTPDEGGGQVSLGITTNLKVDAGTKAATKSVVSGDKITYPVDQYSSADYAPGLGILVTNKDVNDWYTPDGTEYGGHHIWYMGDEKGANWISIKTKGDTYAKTEEIPYYLKKEVGKVYAYYPYNEDLTATLTTVSSESDLKIPVTVLTSGTIDATANNAKKYWDVNKWAATKPADLVNLSLAGEKDYLYFDATTGGRYVNNGRADNQPPVTPDADPDNLNEKNPGYKINLEMKHGMAMVSFRVYDGGHLSDNDVNLTGFTIQNHDGGSNPFKTGDGSMSLTDGAITGLSTTTAMTRTISNYVLMRQIETGGTESAKAFVSTGTSTSSVNGKTVSKTVSAIVYPVTFNDNEIDVVITLKEGSNPAVEYPITLPANAWEANNNYIYTFSAGRNKLTIMDVTVEAWTDNEQDEIPL